MCIKTWFKNSVYSTVLGIVIILTLTGILSGCFSAAVTGSSLIYDRHNLQKTLSDYNISHLAQETIDQNQQLQKTQIEVTCFHHAILLTGTVISPKQKTLAANLIRTIQGVTRIYNALDLDQNNNDILYDSWITTKLRAKLVAANDVDPSLIKVITNHRVVYLMGVVTHQMADEATQIARHTDGVEKVVKLFRYLKVE